MFFYLTRQHKFKNIREWTMAKITLIIEFYVCVISTILYRAWKEYRVNLGEESIYDCSLWGTDVDGGCIKDKIDVICEYMLDEWEVHPYTINSSHFQFMTSYVSIFWLMIDSWRQIYLKRRCQDGHNTYHCVPRNFCQWRWPHSNINIWLFAKYY